MPFDVSSSYLLYRDLAISEERSVRFQLPSEPLGFTHTSFGSNHGVSVDLMLDIILFAELGPETDCLAADVLIGACWRLFELTQTFCWLSETMYYCEQAIPEASPARLTEALCLLKKTSGQTALSLQMSRDTARPLGYSSFTNSPRDLLLA